MEIPVLWGENYARYPSCIRTVPSPLEFHQILRQMALVGYHHRSGIGSIHFRTLPRRFVFN